MRIAEVVVLPETGKRIIDVELIQMNSRTERQLLHIAVADSQCKRVFVFILQPFVRVEADGAQVRNRCCLTVFKPDIDIDRRRKLSLKKIDCVRRAEL